MSFIRVTRLFPSKAVSFHVKDSFTPEEDVHKQFQKWSSDNNLASQWRFIPLIGFNNPWGEEGTKRGYELLCILQNISDVNTNNVTVKDFPGGLYAVITVPGLDKIMYGIETIHKWLKNNAEYESAFQNNYKHGIDPVPELEIVYKGSPNAPEDFIMDYYIPIKEQQK